MSGFIVEGKHIFVIVGGGKENFFFILYYLSLLTEKIDAHYFFMYKN